MLVKSPEDGEASSGDMTLEADAHGALRFRLHARVTGALLADVRLNAQRMLLLDYAKSTWFDGPNTAANRERWFALDLAADDLLLLFTGRVARAEFLAQGGYRRDGEAGMQAGAYGYRFALGGDGLPVEWRKALGVETLFRVEYRAYQEFSLAAGQAMRLPEKIRVYDGAERLRIVLGVRALTSGPDAAPPVDFGFTPPPDWRPLAPDTESS
ncbi:MAG: hypothetical protein HY342_11480 [Candidatus Lambdaproteobacteria bacterium]|nr:hypothetical protein [Candidatus Lambdaproteobacteria bacterium]